MQRPLRHLPNAIGLLRLASAPVVAAALLSGRIEAAFWVFLIAGLSDAVDGFLARRLGAVSPFGAALDPVADKSLVNAGFLGAATVGLLPWWLAGLVLARDAAMALGAAITHMRGLRLTIVPLAIGKATTGVLIATGSHAMAAAAWDWQTPMLATGLAVAAGVMTLASWVAYFLSWTGELRRRTMTGSDR